MKKITISEPFNHYNSKEDSEQYHIVRLVYGLTPNEFAEKDGGAIVDFSIVDIIVLLNQAGFTTFTSCSGLESDHYYLIAKDTPLWVSTAYVSFKDSIDKDQWKAIRKVGIAAGFSPEDDCQVLRASGSDENKRKTWAKFKYLLELNV